jgi:hypothetical protein
MAKNNGFFKDFWQFFWEKKAWWIVPMFLVFIVLGLLIVFGKSSAVVPFVYVLF